MTIFRVALERHERESAVVELEAATPEEAKDRAVAMARRHDVIWEGETTAIEILFAEPKKGT